MNILVLDDDQSIHAYYRYVLKHIKGVGIITMSHDMISFQRNLRMNPYHVIICDIHMEPISGPDILRAHKEEIFGKEIIMLSCADALKDVGEQLASEGVNIRACLQKPLVPEDLADILECN